MANETISRIIHRLERALARVERNVERPEAELRRRAETVLIELSGIPAAFLLADDRGRYVDVNSAASLLTGYSRSELLKMSVWDLTPGVRRGLGRRLWREFLVRGKMSGVYQICHKNGRVVRPNYVAAANVLPGVHVSALVTAALLRRAGWSR